MALGVKNLPANAGDTGDTGSGRSPVGENGNLLSVLAWRIPWREEPGGLPPIGSQRITTTEVTIHAHKQVRTL